MVSMKLVMRETSGIEAYWLIKERGVPESIDFINEGVLGIHKTGTLIGYVATGCLAGPMRERIIRGNSRVMRKLELFTPSDAYIGKNHREAGIEEALNTAVEEYRTPIERPHQMSATYERPPPRFTESGQLRGV